MTDLDVRPEQPDPIEPREAGVLHRLYHGETHFDFVGKRRIGFVISGVLILISLLSLFTARPQPRDRVRRGRRVGGPGGEHLG